MIESSNNEGRPVSRGSEGGRLELKIEASDGKQHYYLNGTRLREGDRIEVAVADGTWIAGAYCWSGQKARWPGMRIELQQRASSVPSLRAAAVISIPPEHAIVRFVRQ